MGRTPCCEKMGLKKGPWSHEEDKILISHIEKYGHANWRALPKQAGLLRCGKSCRLRWMNYLRPDIKRGNFSLEEEETIIKLHEMLGNRWSTMAARLPGRTDNEIKNVWHTHLKKRLKQNQEGAASLDSKNNKSSKGNSAYEESKKMADSPRPSSSSGDSNVMKMEESMQSSMELLPSFDESFWSDILSVPAECSSLNDESSGMQVTENCPSFSGETHLQFPTEFSNVVDDGISSYGIDDGMDFWYDIFINSGVMPELSEI